MYISNLVLNSREVFFTHVKRKRWRRGIYYQFSGGSRISPRWGRQLSRGAPTYDFAKISQKLHEIERIWTEGRPKFYYVDPPLQLLIKMP